MRNIGLSTFFTRRPSVVDPDSVAEPQNGGSKKTATAAAVSGGAATVRTRPMPVDLTPGLSGGGEAKARMLVMLALAKCGHFTAYASMLRSRTAELENTSNRAKAYSDQLTSLIGSLHDLHSQQSAIGPQSVASAESSRPKSAADIWAATIANYTANAAPEALLGSDEQLQGAHADLALSLTSAGMQDDAASDVAAALACSTHLAATMALADPNESAGNQAVPHDSTACASKIVAAMADRLPAELQGSLNAERSKVVTVLATLHGEVHAQVLSHLVKANLQDHMSDRVRKLLEKTPPTDDTTAEAKREARPEIQHLSDERRHDLANEQELSTAKQRRDDRAQPTT